MKGFPAWPGKVGFNAVAGVLQTIMMRIVFCRVL